MAQQSGEEKDVINAVNQVIHNCIVTEGVDVTKFSTFDVEYVFLKLRSKSVNNIVELSYRDNEDDKVYDFKVNLDEIEVKFDPNNNTKIEINDTTGLVMKYPNSFTSQKVAKSDNPEFKLIQLCVDKIYDTDNVYSSTDVTEKELEEFLDNLDMKTFTKIKEFFETMPKLYHKIEYKNSLDHDRSIELTSLQDFFTLG